MKKINLYIKFSLLLFCLININNSLIADFIDIANKFTVKVKSSIEHPFYNDEAGTGKGAGFLIDKKKGWIFTNAHVSGRGNARVYVAFKDQKYEKVSIYYVDPVLDIAILKIEPSKIKKEQVSATLNCSSTKLNGLEVAAYGHPKGLSFSASRGIISQKRYKYGADWLQTDAAVNPGNSGGPLISLKNGQVVGMNALGLKNSKGLNFAVPSETLCKIYNLLKDKEDPSPPMLPFRFATDNQLEKYMTIGSLNSNKILDIVAGDTITHINNNFVKTPTELSNYLRGSMGLATLTFSRKDKVFNKKIEFKKFPLLTKRKFIFLDGAIIAEDYFLERKKSEKLYLLHSVKDGSLAEENGIYRGLLIVSVNGVYPKSLQELFDELKPNKKLNLIFKGWSSSDNILYDYLKVVLTPKDVGLY